MLQKLELTRTRVLVAAAVALLTVGVVAIAWADASGTAIDAVAASSGSPGADDPPGDISGNCDEAEHAADPECAGTTPSNDTTVTTGATVPTTVATTTPAPTAPAPTPASGVRSFDAAGAGTVTYAVEGGTLRLVSAVPGAGWAVDVERSSGPELDLDFRAGTRRVQVDVEFEDGQVRERVRFRDDADDTRTETVGGTVTEQRPGDDDRSGHGGDDDDRDDDDHDEDRSGHGGDDDRDDDPDDD